MDLGLAGKHVLITGGSKGIGMALAHAFAAEGANIVITSRDKALLEKTAGEVARQHNAKVLAFPADLSKGAERERVHAAFPNVDILVNNAGAIPAGGLLNLTMETVDRGLAAQGVRLHPHEPALLRQDEAAQGRHHLEYPRHGRPGADAGIHLWLDGQCRLDRVHERSRRRGRRSWRARLRHQPRRDTAPTAS